MQDGDGVEIGDAADRELPEALCDDEGADKDGVRAARSASGKTYARAERGAWKQAHAQAQHEGRHLELGQQSSGGWGTGYFYQVYPILKC